MTPLSAGEATRQEGMNAPGAGEATRQEGMNAPGAGDGETPAAQLRRCALAHAGRALETIVEIMDSSKASTGDRLRAAITVMERAYGKQEGAGGEGNKPDMLEDIRAELARLRERERAGAPGSAATGANDGAAQGREAGLTGANDGAAQGREEGQNP